MSIPNYLAKIKSSGVYRYVFDKSEIPVAERSSMRLVVGYSEKGPFNTPVYIDSPQEFIATFGGVSRRMERKGIFFHRMCIQALSEGSILALNLKPFENETSTMLSFNASDLTYSNPFIASYRGVIKYWNAADEIMEDYTYRKSDVVLREDNEEDNTYVNVIKSVYFNGIDGYVALPANGLFNPAPVDVYVPVSSLVKWVDTNEKIANPDYNPENPGDVAAEIDNKNYGVVHTWDSEKYEWVPDDKYEKFVKTENRDDFAKVPDNGIFTVQNDIKYYFIAVDRANGMVNYKLLEYAENKPDSYPPLSSFPQFDLSATEGEEKGEEKGEEETAENIDNNRIDANIYTGILSGEDEYEENSIYKKTMWYVDSVNFRAEVNTYGQSTQIQYQDVYVAPNESALSNNQTAIYDTNRFWKINENIMDLKAVNNSADYVDYMRIVQTGSKEDSVTLFMRPSRPRNWDVKISDWFSSETAEEMPAYLEPVKDHFVSEFFIEIFVFRGRLNNPDLFSENSGTLGSYDIAGNWQPFCNVNGKDVVSNPAYTDIYGEPADALDAMSSVSTSNFIGRYEGVLIPQFKDSYGSYISIDTVFNSDVTFHKCIMALNENILDAAYEADTNLNDIYDDEEETAPDFQGSNKENGNTKPSEMKTVGGYIHKLISATHLVNPNAEEGTDEYAPLTELPVAAAVNSYYMEGYNYETIRKNQSGQKMVDKIFAVLKNRGIREALTNNVDVDYKYWVDTFQTWPSKNMRVNVSEILKDKYNCLGILNFPTIKDCMDFVATPGIAGGFDMNKVTDGKKITLPTEAQGASNCAFFTQVKMTDGTQTFRVPSTALVSNLFLRKWTTRFPYSIVAGPSYGRLNYSGLVGPDYNFARNDLDALEPFGVNAIVYIPRRGTVINSNQTAKQTPVSALSKIHVRELVTYIQDSIEDMLFGYQWELNTPSLRDAIKNQADLLLGNIQSNGGLYAFSTVCDDTNNTAEIIDNEMVVIDIAIEPARGAGKMVQTLTIHRTGGMQIS